MPRADPFFLSTPTETLIVSGADQGWSAPLSRGLARQVSAFLASAADSEDPPLVAGLLPFDTRLPAHLFQARDVMRWSRVACLTRSADRPWAESFTSRPGEWRLTEEPGREEYERSVGTVLALMAADGGDPLRKVVLARSLVARCETPIDPRLLASRLRADPSITVFCVALPDRVAGEGRTLVGATPELLVEKFGSRVISGPLAGSAPRASDPSLDRGAADALLHSRKDLREHGTVVEWIADRLAPHCRRLSVPKLPSLVSTQTMWHLGTRIEGELRDDSISSLELAAELHPTPAVCGLPARRAREVIEELEAFERGYFAGAVGWCDARGDGRWFVTIRCAELSGCTARLYAGAGIVLGSDPHSESVETSAKFAAMLHALGIDEEGHELWAFGS